MPSFKVACPSCEASVLIKNQDLVGTKVECPKCKYRFKVEEPAGEAAADTAKPAKGDKKDKKDKKPAASTDESGKKKKAAGGKKNKKVLGIALAAAAVVLLAVVCYFMFGGDSSKPSGGGLGGGGGPRPSANTGEPDPADPNAGNATPKKPALARSDKEPTNLLPGPSVAVYRFDVSRLRQTPVGGSLFDTAMSDLFRTSMGLEPAAVEQYIHCVVGETERAPFGLIRLKEPAAEGEITGKVAGIGAAKKVNGKSLHPLGANPFLTAVGSAFAARSLFSDVNDAAAPPAGSAEAPAPPAPLGACVYDTQTVLVGDYAVLEEYLGSLKDGYPEFQTIVKKADPPPPPTPKDGAPMGGMPPPMPMGGTAPMPMTAPMPAPMTTPPAPPTNKDFTTNPTYLSVSTDLKKMLNALEEGTTETPILVLAEKFDAKAYDTANVKRAYEPLKKVLDPVLARTRFVGANLTRFNSQQIVATVRIVGNSDDDARRIAYDHLSQGLFDAAPVLALVLYPSIEFRNYVKPDQSYPYPMAADGSGAPGMGTTGVGSSSSSSSSPMAQPGPTRPPFVPGSPGSGYPGPGPAYPGSGPGSGPGPGYPGPGPGYPSGGMPGPGRPGDPTQPPQPAGVPVSHFDLRLTDQVVTLSVEMAWTDEVYGRLLAPRLFGYVNQLKGKAAVFAGNYTWHGLARAVTKYVERTKAFPSGSAPRPPTDATRLGMAYPPVQRVSFFAALLPDLGRGGIGQGVTPTLAWYDPKNVTATESWVPELLVPYYPQAAWRAHSTLAPERTFGGTNYVAVAGVGLDAARFTPANPATKKSLGLCGYDWGSKVEDATDGLGNTIYLLQVPPGYSRPWAAGGGATVVGLDPKDPMANFKHRRPDGREGTYAIMGDGAVRWLPADIDPKVFLAMATRAGGETLPDLETFAPRVLAPGQQELKAEPKPADVKPADPKASNVKPAEAKDAPKASPADPKDASKADNTAPAPKPKETPTPAK